MDPRRFRRNVWLIACLAVTIRVGIAAHSWRAVERLEAGEREVSDAQQCLASLEAVGSAVQAAEAAELAYLITGSTVEAGAFAERERAARRELAHAWALEADETDLKPLFQAVARQLDRRFELGGAAAAARRRGYDAERAKIVLKVGGDATRQALAALEELRTAQSALRDRRAAQRRADVSRTLTWIGVTAGVSILFVVLVTMIVLAAFADRVAERDALRPGQKKTSPRS